MLTASGHGLSHVLVDNCYVRWVRRFRPYFLQSEKTEYMVILIDGSAYCTQDEL